MPTKERNDDAVEGGEVPLTASTILKWTSIIFTLASSLVGAIWFAASLKGEIITLQQENIAMKREVEIRNNTQDKEIEKLKDRADGTDKALAELARKLDVAVTLLERIDKKVGNP